VLAGGGILPETILDMPETLGGQLQGLGHAALRVGGVRTHDLTAGDAVVWTESWPRGKVFGARKLSGEVQS